MDPAIFMVEKIFDAIANGSIHINHNQFNEIVVPSSLPVPKGIHLLNYLQWIIVFGSFCIILQTSIHQNELNTLWM